MVTHDDDSPYIYTVPVGGCDELTSVDESKYEEIHQCINFSRWVYIKKGTEQDIRKKENSLVHCSWCTYLILSTRKS